MTICITMSMHCAECFVCTWLCMGAHTEPGTNNTLSTMKHHSNVYESYMVNTWHTQHQLLPGLSYYNVGMKGGVPWG